MNEITELEALSEEVNEYIKNYRVSDAPRYVYLLSTKDGIPFYIGQTRDPKQRMQQHITTKQCKGRGLYDKMQELKVRGELPIITILEKTTCELVDTREKYWIQFYLDKQYSICNKACTKNIQYNKVARVNLRSATHDASWSVEGNLLELIH